MLSFLGVASVIKASPALFTAVRYLGAAYLLYLGLKILYATFMQKKGHHEDKPLKAENAFNKALILSLTNPKAILFYVSFFIQFIDFNYSHPAVSYGVLALILETVSFCISPFNLQRH